MYQGGWRSILGTRAQFGRWCKMRRMRKRSCPRSCARRCATVLRGGLSCSGCLRAMHRYGYRTESRNNSCRKKVSLNCPRLMSHFETVCNVIYVICMSPHRHERPWKRTCVWSLQCVRTRRRPSGSLSPEPLPRNPETLNLN